MVVKKQQVKLPRGFLRVILREGDAFVDKAIPPVKACSYRIPLSNAPRSL